jgi:hypothetical protein
MHRLARVWIALLMVPFAVLAFPTKAQTSKGALAGVVRDASGAVIANANVTVTNEQTTETRQTKSNAEGEYRVDAISAGSYSIRAEAAGFQSIGIKGLKVNPSVITSHDAVLPVGTATATVEVQANSNTIKTDNGQLSSKLGNAELTILPIFSLNPIELVATLPGVQMVNAQLNLGGVGGNYEHLK